MTDSQKQFEELQRQFFENIKAAAAMPYHEWVRRTFGPFGPMHYIDPRREGVPVMAQTPKIGPLDPAEAE